MAKEVEEQERKRKKALRAKKRAREKAEREERARQEAEREAEREARNEAIRQEKLERERIRKEELESKKVASDQKEKDKGKDKGSRKRFKVSDFVKRASTPVTIEPIQEMQKRTQKSLQPVVRLEPLPADATVPGSLIDRFCINLSL